MNCCSPELQHLVQGAALRVTQALALAAPATVVQLPISLSPRTLDHFHSCVAVWYYMAASKEWTEGKLKLVSRARRLSHAWSGVLCWTLTGLEFQQVT